MILRCRYLGRSNSLGNPGFAYLPTRNTNHNAPAINTPPYTCAIDNGSFSSKAPHNTPNGGIKNVVVIDRTGPMAESKRKYNT